MVLQADQAEVCREAGQHASAAGPEETEAWEANSTLHSDWLQVCVESMTIQRTNSETELQPLPGVQ